MTEKDLDENKYASIFGKNKEDGPDFVKENKDKIKILIENEEYPLEYKYKLNLGYNKKIIKLISDEIYNLGFIFSEISSIKNIYGLKYLDTKNVKIFSSLFFRCSSLLDINVLKNWNVSNGTDFNSIFMGTSLSDISALKKWDVSNGIDFSFMFMGTSISDISPLKDWNVSNGTNFSYMFSHSMIKEIKIIRKLECFKKQTIWKNYSSNVFL